MYNFIYFCFYKFAEKKNPSPSSYAAGAVMIAQVSHFLLFYLIVRHFFFINFLPKTSSIYLISKLSMIPLSLIWVFVTDLYYNKKRRENVLRHYENTKIRTFRNVLLLLIYILLPIVLIFVLASSNHPN